MAFADIAQQPRSEAEIDSAATVIVCITCRRPVDPEDFPRPGLAFADAVAEAAKDTGVRVKRVRCLANCKRGLSAAVRREAAGGTLERQTGTSRSPWVRDSTPRQALHTLRARF